MSWFDFAGSFIDTVGVSSWGGSYAVVVIGTKRYNYSGTDGYAIKNQIARIKKIKNKNEAGRLLSQYLKKLQPFLEKQDAPPDPPTTLFPM
jgi:hypothetical protein